MRNNIQKVTSCLCFDDQAEEAVNFYISIFKNSKIVNITRCGEDEPGGPKGSVRTVAFQLSGQEFMAVNGGPHFKFNDGISFMVNCETQEEVDELWGKLSEGGEKIECGWLKDKYGVFWQITPTVVGELLNDPDPAKSQRVMNAIYKMDKLNIETLKRAYEGQGTA